MSDEQPAAPVGVTPGSEALTPEPVDEQLAQPDPLLCPICSHALAAHTGGRCLIALGAYGTEGPCPCPEPLP
jgi:hypothetical protein